MPKVLIIEDSKIWLKLFYILVGNATKHLFAYEHTDNLTDALQKIKETDYSLILLDLMLPDSHAVNTVKTVAEQVKNIPIVIITTLDDEKLAQEARNYGVNGYLVKDQYDLTVFKNTVKDILQKFEKTPIIQDLLDSVDKIDFNTLL